MQTRQVVNPVVETGATVAVAVETRLVDQCSAAGKASGCFGPQISVADSPLSECSRALLDAGLVMFQSPLVAGEGQPLFQAPPLAGALYASDGTGAFGTTPTLPFRLTPFVRLPQSGVWDLDSALGAGEPVSEIVCEVVATAVQCDVLAIRWTRGNFGVTVEVETAAGWREQMRVPDCLWESVRQFLREICRLPEDKVTSGQMVVRTKGASHAFHYYEESERNEPRLFLVREHAH